MSSGKKSNLWSFTVRLFRVAAPVKGQLTVSTLASILGNVAQMTLVGFGAALLLSIDGKIGGSPWLYGFLLILSALTIVIGRYVEGYVSHAGAYRLLADMRVKMFQCIRRLAPAGLIDRSSGDLLSAAIADIETLEYFFAHTIGPIFTVILLPVMTLLLAFRCGTIYALVLFPVYVIISVVLPLLSLKTGRKIGQKYRKQVADYQSMILESVYGLRDMQIFGYGARRKELLAAKNREINHTAHLRVFHNQLVTSAPTFFIYLARISVIAVASLIAVRGDYDGASIVILSFVISASFSSTQSLTSVITNLLETYAAAERIFAVEDAEPAVKEHTNAVPMPQVETIELKNLSFSYGEAYPTLLDSVDLRITKGEKVGIIGESGLGKSTIARLLLRFWEPNDGEIRINGASLSSFTLESIHQRIALLEQDTFLFNDTIAANIALGKPNASQEEIERVAKLANIHDFICTLPEGYRTSMGEMADRLSGGERQRLGIARTLLMDPDVLILDEPTSSLDVLNEKHFLKTLEEACVGKTILIVSHRMSTVSICQRILHIKDAKLTELSMNEKA